MGQHPIFDVSPDQIAALDDEGVRLLIARLCEAELRRCGLPVTAVLYGGSQIAPDGGIDVRVELPAGTGIDGPIPRPTTVYQAKAMAMGKKAIEDEMRPRPRGARRRAGPPGELRPSIRDLADKEGAYVIVSSKDSTTPSALADRRRAMADAVSDLDDRDRLHLDFYDRQRMATWVRDYPGEILWLRARIRQSLPGWRPYGNWSHVPDDVDNTYLRDEQARLRDLNLPQNELLTSAEGIARLRALLSVPGGIVRLTGLSGTGKTRLLEALFDPNIGEDALDPSWAVYADIGHEAPRPSPGQLAEQLSAEGKRVVMVLDNCPRATHDAIAPACRSPTGTLSLITVDLDIQDERPEATDVFRLQAASEGVIDDLLGHRFPALAQAVRRRIARLSDGNARVALLIADSARQNAQGVNLADLGDDDLFQRLFRQRGDPGEEQLRAAEVLALVYSFDGETTEGDQAELPVLARIGGLDLRDLLRTVDQLRRREIIQTRGRWRAILPQPLATWLAKRALAGLPPPEVAETFWSHERLLKSFAHRLSYLHDSPQAQRIAATWLTPPGRLSDLRNILGQYNDLRLDLVTYLAPVLPGSALDLIERFAAERAPDELGAAGRFHRHSLMSLLRKLAWFPEYFRRVALTMACFVPAGSSPNERNQDIGNLEGLFWPMLSGSAAGPKARLAVVDELLSNADRGIRDSGLIALRGMLHTSQFFTSHDFSFGGRPLDFGWRPRSREDCEMWFGGALEIARRLALTDSSARSNVRALIADAFRGLWLAGCVTDQLEQTAVAVAALEYWPEGWLAVRTILALDAKRMDPRLVARLESLKDRLAPRTLDDRIRCYILVPAHQFARLASREGAESDEGTETGLQQAPVALQDRGRAAYDRVTRIARDLGRQCACDPIPFEHWWPELFRSDAHQAYWFGLGLAEGAANVSVVWTDLHQRLQGCAPERRNSPLLCGFLDGAAGKDRSAVDKILDGAVCDPELGSVFPHLQKAAGIDDAGIHRLQAAADLGTAPPSAFVTLAYGGTFDDISAAELSRLLLALAEQPGGHDAAVEILAMYLHEPSEDRLPWDSAVIACGRKLLLRYPVQDAKQDIDYQLRKIAEVCLHGPEMAQDAVLLSERIRDAARDWRQSWRSLDDLVGFLLTQYPDVVLTCWLDGDPSDWSDILGRFVDVDRNPLREISTQVLLAWAGQAPGKRYQRLASVIPVFDREDDDGSADWSESALRLLETAPDRPAFFDTLVAQRIPPRVWAGSRADALEQRRRLLQRFLEDRDPEIVQATRKLDLDLQQEIERERSREGERDERFE